MKTHLVFASGGIGSYITGKRVKRMVNAGRNLNLEAVDPDDHTEGDDEDRDTE